MGHEEAASYLKVYNTDPLAQATIRTSSSMSYQVLALQANRSALLPLTHSLREAELISSPIHLHSHISKPMIVHYSWLLAAIFLKILADFKFISPAAEVGGGGMSHPLEFILVRVPPGI